MPKKLQQSELEKIINPLPSKDRTALREQELTTEWLEASIANCRRMMKRDLWVGLPWFAAFSIAWFTTGDSKLSIGIFVVGMIYFVYAFFTTGSFGLNRRRVKVYEELLERIK